MKPVSVNNVTEKYWECIPDVWHATRSNIRAIANEKFHLTVGQFQVLRRIRKGIASVSELAAVSQTSRSSVSKVVDILVNRGFVQRHQDPNDRRNIPLSLTESGQKVMTLIFQETEGWLEIQFGHLESNELHTLMLGMCLLQRVFLGKKEIEK